MTALTQLVVDALGFMNRSFADPSDVRSVKFEFYAQVRRLWDRGVPVGLGLGHILFRPTGYGFEVVRIGEDGKSAGMAGVVGFGDVPDDTPGERILIAIGPSEFRPRTTLVTFDPARWTATAIEHTT
jgi:hypothetical protein